MVGIWLEYGWEMVGKWLDPNLKHTENILELKRIVTNVAIAHTTIAHEDDQITAHKK